MSACQHVSCCVCCDRASFRARFFCLSLRVICVILHICIDKMAGGDGTLCSVEDAHGQAYSMGTRTALVQLLC